MKPDGIHARNIELGKKYGTTDRTVREWRKDGRPVDNPVEMANLIMVDSRSTERSRACAEQILTAAMESGAPAEQDNSGGIDPDWKEVMESASIESLDAGTVDRLRRLRTFFMGKLEKATKLNNNAMIKLYTEQVIALENAIGKNQLIAKRLGIDAGEILNRDVVEKFLVTFGYLLMRSVDDDIDALCKSLVGLQSAEEARPIIEEHSIKTRFLRPFKSVIEQRSGLGLPEWFVNALIDSACGQVEDYQKLIA